MRQNIGRIDHVVYAVSGENLDAAGDYWTRCYGVEFEQLVRDDLGLRILLSWSAGIELIAPIPGHDAPVAQAIAAHIAEHGEGFFSLCFGVDTIDGAMEKIRDAGFSVVDTRPNVLGDEPWADRYTVIEEAAVESVLGMQVTISAIEPA